MLGLMLVLTLNACAMSAPLPTPIAAPKTAPERAPVATKTPDLRRVPGTPSQPAPTDSSSDPNRQTALKPVPPPEAWKETDRAPVPDRWRILNTLGVIPQRWYDPYNQNTLKGDKPLFKKDWFLSLSLISDTIYEPRELPTPAGPQSSSGAGSTDVFGEGRQSLANQNLILALILLKGDTTFRPPDLEFHFTPVLNLNYTESQEQRLLEIDPRGGDNRSDQHIGVQELFADFHLRNVSERYDFDSVRLGIQPFSTDFRGFLFQDNQLALRVFGTRSNNRYQYNLAWIRRLEKDTNSGLNAIEDSLRDDDIVAANLYWQDLPTLGHTSQVTVVHNRNRETDLYFDNNGFQARPFSFGNERPRDYDVTYLGYNGDGHFGRFNLTTSLYGAFGEESEGVFRQAPRDIAALFAAAEASVDYDWMRLRISALYGSGDDDPFDDEANGFDAIFENPIFAGADTSFWIRQAVPLIGGGVVALSARNGVLNSLRHSKEHGQSNFTNPGMVLAGIGSDFDLTPQLRLSTNGNYLAFDRTEVLEVARNQGNIDRDIGLDLSAALIWRPFFSQNIVLRLSAATLIPGEGFRDLFPDQNPYSVLGNLILTY